MSVRLKKMGQIGIALLLAVSLSATAGPAWAEKGGGKPEWAGGRPDHRQGGPGAGHGRPAAPPGHGSEHGSGYRAGQEGGSDLTAALAAGATAATISALLGGRTQVLSVGAKPLPPGIAKNLARGKPLPPGIAKQAVPQPLLARLPVVDGHTWIRIGTELVLVGIATSIIAQVISNVFD